MALARRVEGNGWISEQDLASGDGHSQLIIKAFIPSAAVS